MVLRHVVFVIPLSRGRNKSAQTIQIARICYMKLNYTQKLLLKSPG
ncbi:hypothetical protein CEV32_3429 [Brucella rhizosphaerae]|uniref:Uncharacterized protein n=1 Tax=Brucella rhizosphaerae TaxID=571254 RepID=A0A256FSR3_9HYPH|nr:hypothetical protein CEV32_3429 [Brucella rhizosphaerae]